MGRRWLLIYLLLAASCSTQPSLREAHAVPTPALPPVAAPQPPAAVTQSPETASTVTTSPVAASDAGQAAPAPAADPVAELLALSGSVSTSIGGPSSGTLRGGVALPERGPGFYRNPKRPIEAGYGSVELVQAIVRAAAVVEQSLPGSVLTVNDLGLREGGPIRQHGSHQAGRDADILFFVLDAQGKPIPSVGVPLDPSGKGWDFKDLSDPSDDQRVKLDAPRTWRFMQALLEAAGDDLQRIFIVEHVRTLLLAQAERARAPSALRERFAELTCQPSSPHDDHMHVRWFCSAEDIAAGCQDSPPLYAWRAAALRALGTRAVLASAYTTKAEREAVAQRTTTPAQARKRAGPMHARVRSFLAQREAWLEQPHPGRTHCR